MLKLSLENILLATKGQCFNPLVKSFEGFGTDTRKNLTGKLFIALKGEAFDGHDYLIQAQQAGATGILVHKKPHPLPDELKKLTVIEVPDTLLALQDMGNWFRKNSKAKILGLTGSNGKTSTKEFAAQIIETKKRVHWSQGSFNNHWGVPFSLMDLTSQHEVALIEMGMNHAGEIKRLVEIADPDVVVCTMVGRAHIEFFGTQEKIALAKQEIYLYSRTNSLAVFNLDNPFTFQMWQQDQKLNPQRPRLTFSEIKNSDVQMQLVSFDFNGLKLKGQIKGVPGEALVPIFGQHNVTNLLAASALALAAGLKPEEIWQGLRQCKSHWGRNQKVQLKSGAVALFDAYNANPDSMEALLKNIQEIPAKRKIGVFGQMKELGELSSQFHEQLGRSVASVEFENVFFYGDDHTSFAKGLAGGGFQGKSYIQKEFSESLAITLSLSLKSGDLVTFKASRGLRLERMLVACEPLNFSEKY
jgi:UDP-N-acetylmuramoyl-tripeptide--D-alanyl-D-alanine ligase